MVKVTYIEDNGTKHTVEADTGLTVMEVAVKNGIPGIDADCGGACACATCHVFVDPAFAKQTGSPTAMEESMLDFASERNEQSRLSCQINLDESMDGLVVTMPAFQG